MKTTLFGINMGQYCWQACFKFHLYKQSSDITISSLCFLNLTSCTVTVASVIMCCTEVCGYLVMSFITIKSLHMGLHVLFIYFWVVCRCSLGTTVTITSVIMCCTGCTEICGHLVMSFITMKSLHIDLLIHILGGMQMFCGHNCNYNICSYVLYCTEVCSHLVTSYHNKVSSHGSTHSYIFWVVCRCPVGTTVTITSVIMCCTEVCDHLVMSFVTIKSLHIDLLIHILGGMQMFCGPNCS